MEHVNNAAVIIEGDKLSYVGQECVKIPSLFSEWYGPRIKSLDLSYNSLTSLAGLEHFPLLHTLVADNNLLPDSARLPRLPHLHTLSLNKNKLRDLERLLQQVSSATPNLRHLSLLGNTACPNQLSDLEKDEEDYRRYRFYVVHWLPSLQFLDSTPVNQTERTEAQRRGAYMKVVKPPSVSTLNASFSDVRRPLALEAASGNHYSPLPETRRPVGLHRGAYGKCRYRYSGKHSEGNRFIHNNDL